VILKWEWVR